MKEKKTEKKSPSGTKNILYLVVFFILAAFVVFMWAFPNINATKASAAEFSDVKKICELATLKCYYHNVTEYEKEPDGIFKYGIAQYGYKKIWMEYDGIVEVGIDISKVEVKDPDSSGAVRIYVPEAQILSVDADKDSMSTPIVKTGWLTKVTATEKAKAFSEAQKSMRQAAEEDSSIFSQAQDNAKELLKQYIVRVGKELGKKYTVEWIDEP